MTVPDQDLVVRMRARVRRHLLVSLGGILLAILCIGTTVGIAKSLDPSGDPPAFVGFFVLAIIFVIPAVGLWSTIKNLRCPKCDGSVAWQVSANFSVFSGQATKHCRHCDAKIFPDDSSRRVLVLSVIAIAIGAIGAILNVLMSSR